MAQIIPGSLSELGKIFFFATKTQHFLGPLQFQLQKFDCMIIGQDSSFAELAPRGCRTYPVAGQVGPS